MSETVDGYNIFSLMIETEAPVLSSILTSELLIPTVNCIGSTLEGIELIVYKLCVLCRDMCVYVCAGVEESVRSSLSSMLCTVPCQGGPFFCCVLEPAPLFLQAFLMWPTLPQL